MLKSQLFTTVFKAAGSLPSHSRAINKGILEVCFKLSSAMLPAHHQIAGILPVSEMQAAGCMHHMCVQPATEWPLQKANNPAPQVLGLREVCAFA